VINSVPSTLSPAGRRGLFYVFLVRFKGGADHWVIVAEYLAGRLPGLEAEIARLW
jgi:hypothetical protein